MRISRDSPEGLFRRLDKAHAQAINQHLAEEGLGDLGQPMLLMILARTGKDGVVPSQKELADKLDVSPATVTVSLRSLERQGYVTKLSDANDMRRKPVAITDKGLAAVEKLDRVYETIDMGMYWAFSEEERDTISNFYRRMIENLGKIKDRDILGKED